MRDKDRAMLFSCCLALCPLAPWQAFRFSIVLSYRRQIIVYRFRYRMTEIVSVRYYRIVIERNDNTETLDTISSTM